MTDTEIKLLNSFPQSFVNCHGEFIAHERANEYFILRTCKDDLDIKCKILEWLSRGTFKTEPYRQWKKNNEFHQFMRNGINAFFETGFSEEQMGIIYEKLGNAVDHEKTIRFIESGYNFAVLGE